MVEGEAGGMEKTRQPGRGQGLAGKPHPPPLISVEESGSDKENNGNQVMAREWGGAREWSDGT